MKDKKILQERVRNSWTNTWVKGSEIAPNPWLVYISPTNVCNQSCAVCALRDHNVKSNGFMTEKLFKSIVDQLFPETQRVYLMKQGEPLLHPKICDFAEYLKSKRPDIEIAIHTNATMLTKEVSDRLVKTVDFLTFSIHTIREENYQNVHGGNFHLKDVIENCQYFLKKRSESQRNIKVYVDYVKQNRNKDETSEEIIKTFNQLFPDTNIGIHNVFSFQNAIEEGVTVSTKKIDEKLLPRCIFPWIALTILHDGEIGYCITEPREKVSLGNVQENSLKEIWNNDNFKEFRLNMKNGDYSALHKKEILCRDCSWLWSMEKIHKHLIIDRDKIHNNEIITKLENSKDQIVLSYIDLLKGNFSDAKNRMNEIDTQNNENDVKFIANYIDDYHKMWENHDVWEQICKMNNEDYEKFNEVEYVEDE